MKKFIAILFLFPFLSFCQKSFLKEFTFIADNDFLISFVNDHYYSSGLFFSYRYVTQKNPSRNLEKRIKHWSLSHKIYTPYKSIVVTKSQHDRPFAALLYASYGNLDVKKNHLLQTQWQIGMIGFAALGKEIQEIIHNIYGFEEPIGWRYQIKNSIALNYLVEITRKIGKEQHRFSDAFYSYGFSVGTIHTHTNVSLSGRIGLKELANFKNSIAFGTHLSSTQKRKIESFLHWKINSKIVVYDATMQGNLFDNKSPVTFTPNRFQFLFELGYKFTANRWNFGYKAVYQTNERSNLVFDNGHFYGSLFISKLFK